MEIFSNADGYTKYHDDESGEWVTEHQLAALVDSDPHEVFGEGQHVHHIIDSGFSNVQKLDLPSNVCPLSASAHMKLENNGGTDAPIERILCRDD